MFSQGAFSEWTYWLAVVLPFASVHPQTCIFLVEVISQCRSLMGNPGVLKPRWATYWVQSGQEEFLAPFWERVISFIEPARIKVEAWKLPEWFTCHSLQSERWLGIWEVWDLWLIIMHITCSLTRFLKKWLALFAPQRRRHEYEYVQICCLCSVYSTRRSGERSEVIGRHVVTRQRNRNREVMYLLMWLKEYLSQNTRLARDAWKVRLSPSEKRFF